MDALLDLLTKNARTPAADLARLLAIPVEEVEARMRELESDRTILGYQAILDPEKSRHGEVTAVIEVRITPERGGGFDRLASRIARFDQVLSCYLMSGGYDLLVVVQGSDLREIARFVAEKLSSIEGVLSTATHFRLRAYKENGLMLASDGESKRLAVSP